MNEYRTLLVDDHAIWRGGVAAMLVGSEFTVVGEASNGKEALTVAATTHPHVVLLDIRMAGGDGLEALAALKQQDPLLAIVMLTTYDNPTYMARAVAGGAAGYLFKTVSRDELLGALRTVVQGEMLLKREELTRALRSVGEQTASFADLIAPLSPREEEVLRYVAEGLSNKEIGNLLFIGDGTVKSHVEHILAKLGLSDRVQAAVWAMRHGLVAGDNVVGNTTH
jgi:DNA-binding NarL/FixJ family response regulator